MEAGAGGKGYAAGMSGRTALGFNRAGELLIYQVDGHTSPPSWGATMYELADKMIEFGAVEAINLDGGGSTAMVHEGVEVGYSSDRTAWGPLLQYYDPKCPIGHGKGNLSNFECRRAVSTILCVHESPKHAASPSATARGKGSLPVAGSTQGAGSTQATGSGPGTGLVVVVGAVLGLVGCVGGFAIGSFV